ncbi:transcriptional regulator [Candidatus Pacearchaeota archaeon]|nr:MAG: transcriptional regulator [Candidatus Pacearchaeota archaeon]
MNDFSSWKGIWKALGCKWTFHIIRLLDKKKHRFNELKNSIGSIPATTLSSRLKELEREGIVKREVKETIPVSVEYYLTKKGRKLVKIVNQIEKVESES